MKPLRSALLVTILMALGVTANAAPASRVYLLQPAWKSAPSRSEVDAAVLSKTKGLHEEVWASVSCRLKADGSLTACDPVQGVNTDGGIAASVLALIPKFAAYVPNEVTVESEPVFVKIDFHFQPTNHPAATVELAAPELLQSVGSQQAAYAFPPAAAAAGYKSGFGVIDCDGAANGAPVNCSIVSEMPTNFGFGQNALAAAKTMSLNPWQRSEPIAGSRLRISIHLEAPGADSDPAFTRQAIFVLPSAGVGTAGRYFPDRALRLGVNGSAVIQCTVSAEGDLSDCSAISESALDFGFARASLRMAQLKLIKAEPRMVDGHPVDHEIIQVVVPFVADQY